MIASSDKHYVHRVWEVEEFHGAADQMGFSFQSIVTFTRSTSAQINSEKKKSPNKMDQPE